MSERRKTLPPRVIEKIKDATNNCPNVYFGTPDYPVPAVSCGLNGCRLLETGCKKMPGENPLPDDVQAAIFRVRRNIADAMKESRKQALKPKIEFVDPSNGYDI